MSLWLFGGSKTMDLVQRHLIHGGGGGGGCKRHGNGYKTKIYQLFSCEVHFRKFQFCSCWCFCNWRGCHLFMLLLFCHEWVRQLKNDTTESQPNYPRFRFSNFLPLTRLPWQGQIWQSKAAVWITRQSLPYILSLLRPDGGISAIERLRLFYGVSNFGNTKYPIASLKRFLFHFSKEWLFPIYFSNKKTSTACQTPSRRRNKARKPAAPAIPAKHGVRVLLRDLSAEPMYALQPGVRLRLHMQSMYGGRS